MSFQPLFFNGLWRLRFSFVIPATWIVPFVTAGSILALCTVLCLIEGFVTTEFLLSRLLLSAL